MTDTSASTLIPSRKWDVPSGCIGAGIAESDLGTAPAITEALSRQITQGTMGYCPDALAAQVRERLTWYLGERFSWRVAPECVDLLPDVVSGYSRALRTLLAPGDAVILPTPAYTPFLRVPDSCNRPVIQVPMHERDGRWTLDLEDLDRAFSEGGRLLVLCSPHNPTGTVPTRSELLGISDVVEHHRGLVFADEIHSSIVYPAAHHTPYASVSDVTAAHTVTALSTSKGWNVAGLKCAQVIIPNPALQAAFGASQELQDAGQSILGCVAAAAAYTPAGVAWLDRTVAQLQRNRDSWTATLAAHAPILAAARPQATYLSWVRTTLPTDRRTPDWVRETLGLCVNDGRDSGSPYAQWFRFNFALRPEVLTEACNRIDRALG